MGLSAGFIIGTEMSWVKRSVDSNSLCLQWAHAKEETDFEEMVGVKSCQDEVDFG